VRLKARLNRFGLAVPPEGAALTTGARKAAVARGLSLSGCETLALTSDSDIRDNTWGRSKHMPGE
jgi:hypothetical protein